MISYTEYKKLCSSYNNDVFSITLEGDVKFDKWGQIILNMRIQIKKILRFNISLIATANIVSDVKSLT